MAETGQIVEAGQLTRRAVEAISERHGEPRWMREFRLDAFEAFERLPWPTTRDEKWRRTDLSGLKVDELTPFAEAPAGPLPAGLRMTVDAFGAHSGLLVQRNSVAVHADLDGQVRERGVVLADMHQALREQPDLVREHFMRYVRPEKSKFSALHAAFWTGGTFLYVPPHVEVALPLQSYTWIDAEKVSIFPHTIIVAGEGSKVTVIDGFGSLTAEYQAFADPIVELALHEGAQVRYVTMQDWGRNVWEVGIIRSALARDATLNSLLVGLGGKLVKADVESVLQGPGASSEMLGLVFGDGRQHYDIQTLQEHAAPHTTSDLLYKNAVKDRATSVFIGMIRVHPGAQKTNAFQVNRNLILSDGAKAISDPKLEIMANDLRCTHGSATSRLNEEHLFYLMSRGLTRAEAVRMVVEGFFAELFERVPLERVGAQLHVAVAAKMNE
ncbi:MAG: Fe-S cluster assembly protein SufD [Armatimonadetes bacterium]|nr:Fe-S cluster assembly protein SufD [Armatimonadota bacterium]